MFRRPFTVFEFAYWLQGALEISGMTGFTQGQVEAITRRLGDIDSFDAALAAFLGSVGVEDFSDSHLDVAALRGLQERKAQVAEGLRYPLQIWITLHLKDGEAAFTAINAAQQKIFIHDIDPTYEGDQDYFHAVHRGEREPP
jgi:hypothetical protein